MKEPTADEVMKRPVCNCRKCQAERLLWWVLLASAFYGIGVGMWYVYKRILGGL